MATTTNYGWTTPDDTALVKDGAAAIRTLGSSVDTTTKNLNPSTTLGDIEYRSSTANTNTRLGIGTTGQVLSVSGGVPAWATPVSGAGNLALITSGSLSGTSLSVSSLSSYTNISLFFDSVTWSTAAGDDLFITINGVTTSVYRQMGWLESNSPASDRLGLGLLSGIRLTVGSSYFQRHNVATNTYFVNLSNCKNTGFTNFEILSTYIDNSALYRVNFIGSGIFEDTSAVSSISFSSGSSYTFNGGTYRIYGE